MKKIIIMMALMLAMAACSQNGGEESATEGESIQDTSSDEAATNGLSDPPAESGDSETGNSENSIIDQSGDRMLIYHAVIELETEDYEGFRERLDQRMEQNEAYIVEANVTKGDRNLRSGQIRLRVPQQNFEAMIGQLEQIGDSIISENISGRDVTEQYVDLESRLAAKEKVEGRLLSFLDESTATDSLLKISQDLERIQSEIEVLKGKMNYLQNQSDFSTITLQVTETTLVVGEVGGTSQQTWDRTKQAFVSSINGLMTFLSWLFVTIVGYSPILIPILLVAGFIWYRKRKRMEEESS
ncbi:DUF4349 domain-containing protein [Halobacillus litoralis]|uniref:DUF4349 domain-containing protein n=1 Tax=Halobacillus litoralis TaxID=45668 RepID=UPI001CD3BAE8|nr:DUF4349 domain-containing protein [Halobacillus litoralis]MCA0969623.1 DUF4349 domain-containing protein [Halobacillus litoralis]